MDNEDKILKELFSSRFADQEIGDKDDLEWMGIQQGLDKHRFIRFSWTRFNIFYALAILLSLLFTSASSIKYLFFEKENVQYIVIKEQESKLIRQDENGSYNTKNRKNELDNNQTASTHVRTHIAEHEKDDIKASDKVQKQRTGNQASIPLDGEVIQPDQDMAPLDNVIYDSDSIPSIEQKEESKVQKIIVIRQDTIIRYDSVKIKPKMLFFKKK